MIEIALYQPDIAANTGTIARMCACFDLPLIIIEPAGYAWTDSSFRRAGMDYLSFARVSRCPSWTQFKIDQAEKRVILLTTKAPGSYLDFCFRQGDVLLVGRESAGVPDSVSSAVGHQVTIPIKPPARSLNVAIATAIVTGEALRQLRV